MCSSDLSGAGNSSSLKEYSFNDPDITTGIIYYRLKQIDINGDYKYSHVVALNNVEKGALTIQSLYPNPFGKEIGILFNKTVTSPVAVSIFDAEGKLLLTETYPAFRKNIFINTENFSEGVYFLTVETGDSKLVKRISKY